MNTGMDGDQILEKNGYERNAEEIKFQQSNISEAFETFGLDPNN